MNSENKAEMRKLIDNPVSGWNRYGIIDEAPDGLHWNKEMEVIYEDMDGNPIKCKAIYVHEFAKEPYFEATSGAAKTLRLMNVFAYRYEED